MATFFTKTIPDPFSFGKSPRALMFLPFVLFHELLVFCKFERGMCFLQLLSSLPASKDAGIVLVCFKGFTANYQDMLYNKKHGEVKKAFRFMQ